MAVLFATACGSKLDPLAPEGLTTDAITWYRDVLPLVQANCQGCHQDGGIGPFSMERYGDAALWANEIHSMVRTRDMPPWMPADDCQPLLGRRGLSDAEVEVFLSWVEGGSPAGDPAHAPPPSPATDTLAHPDFEGDTGADYLPRVGLPGSPQDDYHCFIVDPQLAADKFLVGFEILPRARENVHHVIMYQGSAANAQAADDAEPDVPGWTCFGGAGLGGNTLMGLGVGAWAPGTPVTRYPEGTGIRLTRGNVLVLQVHYSMSENPPHVDRTGIQLQYADAPVTRAEIYPALDQGFVIPKAVAGEPQTYQTTQSLGPVPISFKIYGVFPHMHVLGRSIRFSYVMPNGSEICLSDVPKWDFHWQQFYFFDTPDGLVLPADGRFVITCEWDRHPDRAVRWGEGTTDEMCLAGFYTTTVVF